MTNSVRDKVIVISGIDTDIGKTVATGLIARWLKDNARNTITMKMVQTGGEGISEDIIEHRKLAGLELQDEDALGLTCPYIFSVPCSPHLAARLEGRRIDCRKIVSAAETLAESYDCVLLEGVGGLFVPLDEEVTVIDLVKEHNWPLILVTGPRLGSINHTLAALEAIENRGVRLRGLIYNRNGSKATDPRIVDDSRNLFAERIKRLSGSGKICDIPEVACTESYCVDFSPLFN